MLAIQRQSLLDMGDTYCGIDEGSITPVDTVHVGLPSREWLEFEGGGISALFQRRESAESRR
jgi:hypothetical protein